MENAVKVRIAESTDTPELSRLNKQFTGVDESPVDMARRMSDPNCVEQPLIAEINNRVIGFAALRIVPCVFSPAPRGELTELFIEEEHRRQGIGRKLIALAEEVAKRRGVMTLFILTNLSNKSARAFYNSMDYQDNDIVLCKDI